MRKRIFVGMLALVLALMAGGGAMAASWAWPGGGENIDEMASTATYIVRVEVLAGRQVRVLEVFQGDIQPGDTISVGHLVGVISRLLVNFPRFQLVPGDDLVLFLSVDSISYPAATLLNPWQGAYRFPHWNESTLTLDAHVGLEDALGHMSGLPLTIGDLVRIAEENFGDGPREVLAHSGAGRVHPGVLVLLAALVIYWKWQLWKDTDEEGKDEDLER
ncbi:MAG: hypothetical protein FWE12_03020 [Oscillospiraceae bacterium]|nr:hypothetical protein [Oscillospiraceae bacterium]